MDETGVTLVSSIRRCPCPCIINNSPDSFTLASLLAPSLISSHLASPRLTSFRLASRACSSRGGEKSRDFVFQDTRRITERGIYNLPPKYRFKYCLFFSTICAYTNIYCTYLFSVLTPSVANCRLAASIYSSRISLRSSRKSQVRRARFTKPRTRENGRNTKQPRVIAARGGDANERPRSRVFSRMISRTGVCTWHSGIITDRMYQTRNQE